MRQESKCETMLYDAAGKSVSMNECVCLVLYLQLLLYAFMLYYYRLYTETVGGRE